MSEKKLSKVKIDEMLSLTREYHENYTDNDSWYGPILQKRIAVAHDAGPVDWLYLVDIVDGSYGMNREITNEDIYRVLEVLGWTVTDDGEEA